MSRSLGVGAGSMMTVGGRWIACSVLHQAAFSFAQRPPPPPTHVAVDEHGAGNATEPEPEVEAEHEHEHGEHHGPHRIPVWFPVALCIFWGVLLGAITYLYTVLRKKNEAAYEDFKKKKLEEGEDDEGEDADHEVMAEADAGVEQSTKEMIKEYGLDGALYLSYLDQCSKFWGLQTITAGVVTCLLYNAFGDRVKVGDEGLPIYAFSMANVDPMASSGWISVVMGFWIMSSGVAFAIWRNKQMDKLKLDADGELHTSRCTLWCKSVPTHVTDETLNDWLDQKYPDQVAGASVALNVHKLGANIRAQKKLINKINKLQEAVSEVPDDAKVVKISTLKELLSIKQGTETQLRDQDFEGSGHAFITFKDETAALEFKSANWADDTSAVGAAGWKVMMAPMPNEIYWENMGFSKGDRAAQKLKMAGIVLAVFIIFILWALIAVLCIGFAYMSILYSVNPTVYWGEVRDGMSDLLTPAGSYILGGVCVVIFLGMEEEMAPVIKFISKTAQPTTKSKKQSIYLGFQYGFYLIYHLVLSTGGLAFLVWACEDPDRPRLYVEMVAAFHINRMFLTSCLIDAFHAFEGVKFIRRPTASLTAAQAADLTSAEAQEDIDDAMHEDDPFFNNKFDYTRNYSESLAVFSVVCYYGAMHPLIMPAGSLYYLIKGKIDKMQIETQYSKPSLQYGRRARTTTKYLLCSVAIGTIGNAIYYLSIAPQHDPNHHKEGTVSPIAYGFLFNMVCGWAVYFGYTNKLQKKLFKSGKKEKTKLSKSRSNGDKMASENGFLEMPYIPPRPDDMVIGVAMSDDVIRDNSPVKFDNPLDEDGEDD